jgi:hypothetical protein
MLGDGMTFRGEGKGERVFEAQSTKRGEPLQAMVRRAAPCPFQG